MGIGAITESNKPLVENNSSRLEALYDKAKLVTREITEHQGMVCYSRPGSPTPSDSGISTHSQESTHSAHSNQKP
uniref:Uncharacterized protein n=1 Tax=Pyramimonas orientalis virus TaxID=455367 RepID=A0A7M3UP84_POV01|nr:hypothetical protein HWQ62_00424 [Pyramimonas orientalis virus]